MKLTLPASILLSGGLCLAPSTGNTQTPEEILAASELAYEACDMLFDHGREIQLTSSRYGLPVMITTDFQVTFAKSAMNYLSTVSAADTVIRITYNKSGDNAQGRLTFSSSPDTLALPIQQVATQIMRTGDGAFYHFCSMRYPDKVRPPTGRASLLNADTLYSYNDTILDGQLCHVIRTVSGYFPTAEMIQASRLEYDSLIIANPKSRLLRQFDFPPVAQTITYTYYIRKSDHLIRRMEGRMYDGIWLMAESIMESNPVCNASN